jgi:hypothetical protein
LDAATEAWASRVLLAVFLFTLAAEHLLQPGLDPERHRVSEYANGSPGWLMIAGFIAWALALAVGAWALWNCELAPRPVCAGVCALLGVAAAGALVTAIFRTGTSAGVVPPGHHLSAANHLHDAGSEMLALALWAGALLSLVLGERRLRLRVVGVLASALACVVALSAVDLPGIEQRALVLLGCVWQYALLAAVTRAGRRGAQSA